MAVKAQPDRYHTIVPYLVVKDAAKCIDFVKAMLDAREEGGRMQMPDGRIGHCELRIGDSILMMAGANDQFPPRTGMIHIYVPDVDAAYRRGLAAGGTSAREPANQFYGDRMAGIEAFGTYWSLATHVEDVPEAEMMRRMKAQRDG
jgi:uncharacterized glyoxalase superfamily protein PhnB